MCILLSLMSSAHPIVFAPLCGLQRVKQRKYYVDIIQYFITVALCCCLHVFFFVLFFCSLTLYDTSSSTALNCCRLLLLLVDIVFACVLSRVSSSKLQLSKSHLPFEPFDGGMLCLSNLLFLNFVVFSFFFAFFSASSSSSVCQF